MPLFPALRRQRQANMSLRRYRISPRTVRATLRNIAQKTKQKTFFQLKNNIFGVCIGLYWIENILAMCAGPKLQMFAYHSVS